MTADGGWSLVEAMADGLAVVDPTGMVTCWNAAAARITGVGEEQALDRPLPFGAAEQGEDGREFQQRLPDGRWIEGVSALTRGDPAHTVVTFRDITAAKLGEQATSLFLATTGHELRTPLTVIRGFADTLLARWDVLSEAERQESVRIIAARAESLAGLVEHVLAGSQAQVGRVRRLALVPLPLGPILAAVLVDVGSLSGRHQVTLTVPSELPLVLADGEAVRTILGHLVDNAVKYSPEGGRVALSAETLAEAGCVRICVDDDGIGVAGADQERIFEQFFRADAAGPGGVGLGLYIVRGLVAAQAGTVTLRARPGSVPGSRVEVRLPLA